VVGNQDSRFFRRDVFEPLTNKLHLLDVDTAILDRQRPGGVDAQYRGFVRFHPGAKILRNMALVTAKRRGKPPDHVIEGHVMIARHDEQFQPVIAQRGQVIGGIPELAFARALGQVPADDHEIGLSFLQPVDRCRDDVAIIGAEMNVRQMCDPGHEGSTVEPQRSFIVHPNMLCRVVFP